MKNESSAILARLETNRIIRIWRLLTAVLLLAFLTAAAIFAQPATIALAKDTAVVYDVAGWQITLEDASRSASLSAVSVELGYTSVETTDVEQSAADGMEYCMLKLSFVKNGSMETIEWEKVFLTDGNGNSYSRIDDSFITEFGMTRLPGTALNFGSYEGWICFEIPEDALDLTLVYTFESEELAIPVEITGGETDSDTNAAEEAGSENTDTSEAEDTEAAETETSESTEAAEAENSDSMETAENSDALSGEAETVSDTENAAETSNETDESANTDSLTDAEVETETEKPRVATETLYDVDGRSTTVVSATEITIESNLETEVSMPEQTQAITDAILADAQENNYTFDDPLLIQDPYQNSPLTALLVFETDEVCAVRVTVKGKTEGQDITDIIDSATFHMVPILGLYASYDNEVVIDLLDENETTVISTKTLSITTDSLPNALQTAVSVDTCTTESAMGLMLISGLSSKYAYAFDETGEIRWYSTIQWEYYGVFPLENGHFLIEAENVLYPNASMPNSPEFWEMDYLGRVYNVYYFPNGVHHDIQEKTPDGNFLILTNSNDGYEQNMIQEIDRETGEVVKSLSLNDLFEGLSYISRNDWAHINTVSYDEETDSILISCRNLHSVIRIDWSTNEILWILADPAVWDGTGYEDRVLTAAEDFQWHYQQHTAYALEEDLDDNPDTVEIMLFDNHSTAYLEVESFDNIEASYVKIYSVDAEAMTVTQLKNYETTFSKITSDAFLISDAGRVFSVNATLPSSSEYRGKIYEIDYDSGDILNTWNISKKFYRGYSVTLSMNDCAEAYVLSDNYIRGTLRIPVEVDNAAAAAADEVLSEDYVSLMLSGDILYVQSRDHMYTQVIFNGAEHTYVYDISDIIPASKKSKDYTYQLPIPLSGMAADTYTIQIMYSNQLYDLDGSFTIS
ncbi:MAG: aryl-sulfate sulfotransferase [Lachnospiraceae bacterium]|nr:aryl-sulfate sulfotransferase [Lachnospiraceae bacterium]